MVSSIYLLVRSFGVGRIVIIVCYRKGQELTSPSPGLEVPEKNGASCLARKFSAYGKKS